MTKAVRIRVGGRVQGVGFRAWTEREAGALALRGWVRNRADGTVEAAFFGPEAAVAEMVRRCRQGPRWGRVDSLAEEPEMGEPPAGFEQRPTA